MNVKTYSFVKYLATLGAILLLLAPLLGFLQSWSYIWLDHGNFGHHFLFKSPTALAATLWVLEIVGIIVTVGYLYLRLRLKNKSPYTYTKKDNQKLNIAFIMYGAGIVLSFIYVVISCGIFGYPQIGTGEEARKIINWTSTNSHARNTGVMIAFAPIYVLLVTSMILGSIFESWSRIAEQEFLNGERLSKEKVNDRSVSKTGTRRTKEAQALFDDEDNKPSKKKSKSAKVEKHKAEVHLDDEKTLEDFFNEDDDSDEKKDNK